MSISKSIPVLKYKIFMDGRTFLGTAEELLEMIRSDVATRSKLIAKMNVRQYAESFIRDAHYYLDEDYLSQLKKIPFATDYDRALRYFSEMPEAGIKILTQSESRQFRR